MSNKSINFMMNLNVVVDYGYENLEKIQLYPNISKNLLGRKMTMTWGVKVVVISSIPHNMASDSY